MALSCSWRARRVSALLRRLATHHLVPPFTPTLRATTVALVGFAAVGCSDPVATDTGPGGVPARASLATSAGDVIGPTGDIRALPALRDSIFAVRVDAADLPPEQSDADLVAAVRDAKGLVFIGFKPPGAALTRATGVIPAIGRSAALNARAAVEAHGARITRTFVNMATVVAEIPPELAPRLRQMGIVNYIEPVTVGRLASQTIDWGIAKVRANQVWYVDWPDNSGQSASITILDSGMDLTHYNSGDGPGGATVRCL